MGIKLYKKKPVKVEAIQWTGNNLREVVDFTGETIRYHIDDSDWQVGKAAPQTRIWIKTLEGNLQVSVGDYIIKGVKGEYYPCKPDIFKSTYEEESE